MKKLVLMLCLTLVLCLVCGCGDNEAKDPADTTPPVSNNTSSSTPEPDRPGDYMSAVFKKPQSMSDYSAAVRAAIMPNYWKLYEPSGFTGKELGKARVYDPFSIYVFDKQGNLLPDKTTVSCPIKVGIKFADGVSLVEEYIGRISVKYNENKNQNEFEYHKDTLLADLSGGTVDTQKILTLGKLGSKTFVTDGVNLDILAVDDTPHSDDLTDSELKALAPTFKAAAGDTYNYVYGYYITVQPIDQQN